MNKLYQKDETTFAIVLIVIYVLGTVLSEVATASIGVAKLVPAIFHGLFAVVLLVWTVRHGYAEKYGLVVPRYSLRQYWFFLPLLVIACSGLCFGIELQYSPLEAVLHVVSMVGVGFLEEIIFRGFLFVGMAQQNVKSAIIVSSLTFGLGHIVNLFVGQPLGGTLVQIVFALAVGFTLVIIFYKGKSLLPCIAFHALNNSLSAFEKTNEEAAAALPLSAGQLDLLAAGACIVLLSVYALAIMRKAEVKQE